jgi:hypothetical protein
MILWAQIAEELIKLIFWELFNDSEYLSVEIILIDRTFYMLLVQAILQYQLFGDLKKFIGHFLLLFLVFMEAKKRLPNIHKLGLA